MSITALDGPLVVYGEEAVVGGVGSNLDYNGWKGPSSFYQSTSLLDPRMPFTYIPGQKDTQAFYGWLAGGGGFQVMDVAPATKANAAIAALANVSSGVAMTLVTSTAAGITVGTSVVNASTGASVTGLLAVGGAGGSVTFGQTASVNIWDPTKLLARAVSITAAASATGGNFTVRGYDVYGYPLAETIAAAAGAATTNGKKAFKYIASVTPAFTDAHNYSVGTTDIIGFPLRVDTQGYVTIWYPEPALITASTGFVAAVTTSPATATTGDVRGTYALQTASDGSNRLTMFISPSVANISSTTGLLGVTQYTA